MVTGRPLESMATLFLRGARPAAGGGALDSLTINEIIDLDVVFSRHG